MQKEHESIEKTVTDLLNDMANTLDEDRNANVNKKPAFKRFKLLGKIDNTLRKISVQEEFLHKEGCRYLYNWLVKMPD